MPFPASWIEEHIIKATRAGRLGHAFLISGSDLDSMETLFHRLAAALLEENNPQHPDLHLLRPESKSRRITVAQIRELEHVLQLKPYRAPLKVAGIIAADRMCLGSAEPANAFLKTLEEPPDRTILFLLTDNPEQLLPTIRSRCLFLPLKDGRAAPDPELQTLAAAWMETKGNAADTAYRRAHLLATYWQQQRANLEKELPDDEAEDDEKAAIAQIESRFLLIRDRSLAHLLAETWQRAQKGALSRAEAELACESLEELRLSLSRNMEQGFALERCCMKIGGLI
ncbi:MAG: hypothetical protein V1746_06720 [bacterium]